MADSSKSIELKRVVMVKAIVTDAFKGNLITELERAINNMDAEAQQMEVQSKRYMETLKQKNLTSQLAAFKHQLEDERAKRAAAKTDLLTKIEQAKNLVVGSEFIQGPIEGPVNVALGDNLYKKIGGAEIIVKDGVIQEIRGM
jgi:hypothetical protein